jgi:hypothetical protein
VPHLVRRVAAVAAAVAGLAACNSPARPQRDHGGSMTETPRPTAPTLHWIRHSPAPGLTLELLDGAPTSVSGDEKAGNVVSGHRPVRVGIWYGPDEGLAHPGAEAGAESAATVCGQPARRLEITTARQPDIHVSYAGGGHGTEPSGGETFVAVGFRHGDLPVVAYYVVETARRAELAADEAHFFASITCR